MARIRERGIPLSEYAGVKPYYGIKTGFNEAFLIDTKTRDSLVQADPRSAEIIKPYLRGQDIKRWSPEWAGLWMIFARRGIDIEAYPAIKAHLERYRVQLEPKPEDWEGGEWPGRKAGSYRWFELQDPVEYWELFKTRKIIYQVIQFYPSYAMDDSGRLGNDKTFFLPCNDNYLCETLNSPLIWWHNWRYFTHLKDEALSPMGYMMEAVPIASPSEGLRADTVATVNRLLELSSKQQDTRSVIHDWLHFQHEIEAPTTKLRDPVGLDSDAFVSEVQKSRGKKHGLTAAGVKDLRAEHARTIEPARGLRSEALALETRLHDLVNAAYGLTPEEVRLMWDTAPPRMPIPRPPGI